ncbi:MAG: 7TM diverse intracellular signaling domain-containing protein [Flavobacteriales bacterium]|nr:7TM diverse intracellular signaling domain-containing protein [Flavobacteriales bacterium]
MKHSGPLSRWFSLAAFAALIVLLSGGLSSCGKNAQQRLISQRQITTDQEPDSLHLWLVEDVDRVFTPLEALHANSEPVKGQLVNALTSQSAFWVIIDGWQDGPVEDLIVIHNPTLDSVAWYEIEGERVVRAAEMGAAVEVNRNRVLPRFSRPLNPTRQLVVRVVSGKQLVMPFERMTPSRWEEHSDNRNIIFALYTGIVLAMLLYNLFLFMSTGQIDYFRYVMVVVTVALVQWAFNGYDRLLWGDSQWLSTNGLVIVGAASGLAALSFTRSFLRVQTFAPGWDKFIKALYVVYGVAFIAGVGGFTSFSYNLVNLGALSAPMILMLSVVCLRRGSPSAGWFLLAWSFFLAGVTTQALRDFNVLPNTAVTAIFLPLGTILEMLLLSFALGDRINQLKKEREEANAKALAASMENEAIVKEQNAQLEGRVSERTVELSQANDELKWALEELRGAQNHLIQSEKLASLGQMTAGIAHELNNPINYVKSNAGSLERDLDDLIDILDAYAGVLSEKMDFDAASAEQKDDRSRLTEEELKALALVKEKVKKLDLNFLKDESRQLIAGIKEGADRTAKIVQGLRVFGRMDSDRMLPASLAELIEASLTVLGNRVLSIATIDVKIEPDLAQVLCQPGRISQVFMNIIVNAVQATEQRHEKTDERLVEIGVSQLAKDVIVRVKDNGIGMESETVSRIFDPFYTTKEVGKGTGLGLSIVKGILDDHKADIQVHSEFGQGTEFVLTFKQASNS